MSLFAVPPLEPEDMDVPDDEWPALPDPKPEEKWGGWDGAPTSSDRPEMAWLPGPGVVRDQAGPVPPQVRQGGPERDPVEQAEWDRRQELGLPDVDALTPRQRHLLAALVDSTELHKLPRPESLLGGVLNQREFTLLSGKFATYKSMVSLGWAYAIATGVSWCGHPPAPDARGVVYVAAEGAPGVHQRIAALEKFYGVAVPAGRMVVMPRSVRLTEADDLAVLRHVVDAHQPALVVFDTWHRMTPGAEENSASDQAIPVDAAVSLRDDFGVTVLAVHHTGHNQSHARGSSALEDDADSSWLIKLGDGTGDAEDRSITTPRTLHHRKSKDSATHDALRLALHVMDDDEGALVQLVHPGAPGSPEHARYAELDALLTAAGFVPDAGRRGPRMWAKEHGVVLPRNEQWAGFRHFRVEAASRRAIAGESEGGGQ